MGLHHPAVARLALTLILGLGSPVEILADELIPADIAFTPAQAEQVPAPANTTDEPAPETLPVVTGNSEAVSVTTEATEPTPAPEQSCSQNPALRKSLSIGNFTRLDPQMSNAGNLYEAEQGIAQLFSQHLRNQPILKPELLSSGIANTGDEYLRQQQAQQIARRTGTQFVVQGFIVDMSMNDPDSLYNPSLYRKAANLFHDTGGNWGRDKRLRQFAFNLELRDGYTGEALLAKTYRTAGIWSVRTPTGFNSAKFRTSNYAQQIDKLVQQASGELAQTIACQPFMVSIDAPPGRTQILLTGGANNGLRAGDQLDIYQLIVSPSNTDYMWAETRLVKRNTRVQLDEVYPSHSTASLLDGEYLNGTFLAVSD